MGTALFVYHGHTALQIEGERYIEYVVDHVTGVYRVTYPQLSYFDGGS